MLKTVAAKQIVPGVYVIPLGIVNAYLIEGDRLTLIDTGVPGSDAQILRAVRALGRQPSEIGHILVTHCHPDHAGGLAALKRETGAAAYMHRADAAIVRAGTGLRPLKPVSGLLNNLLFRALIPLVPSKMEAAQVEHEVTDGDVLPEAGGLRAIHAPGHCAGQLLFLWPHHGGVLFAADAASNMMGLGLSLGYEDLERSRRDLSRVAALEFEVACFSHGRPILRGASGRFRRKWGRWGTP